MKLNEPVIKLCSKSPHHRVPPISPPSSTLCGIFVSLFSRFLFIFLICFLWFTANFTLGVWLRVGSIARRGVDATETPQKKNDLQASRLIDFLIWSRGMRWLHCDRVLQRAQDRTQRGDSRILCKLDPPRIEWHALITSFPSRATHSSRFRFIRIVS